MQRKSVSIDEKDHPESHDGPYSIIEPMVYSEVSAWRVHVIRQIAHDIY